MTGINQMVEELVTKQLGLLHELVSKARGIGVLVDPNNAARSDAIVNTAQRAVSALGCRRRARRLTPCPAAALCHQA
jgi:hypothetical protein